jgi:hypothetical protein
MKWLSDHFWLLFGGVGGTALIGLIGWLLTRLFKEPAERVTTGQTARDSQVTSSPVASGPGIIQTFNIGQPLAPVPAPVPATPVPATPTEDKPRPNMRQTGVRVIRVSEPYPGHLVDDRNGKTEAVFIQFTNEARQGRNVGGSVKASLVYEDNGVEVLRIIGAWMYGDSDSTMFQVDESRKLIVGFPLDKDFVALEMYRLADGHTRIDPHRVPAFQTVRVRLTHASSGDVLYQGRFRVTLNPLAIVAEDL